MPNIFRTYARTSVNLLFSTAINPIAPIVWHPNFEYHSQSELELPRLDYTVNRDVMRSNWMISKLSKEGRISDARKMFDQMPDPDVITWTAVISGYIRCGMIKEARRLFDRVDGKKNVALSSDSRSIRHLNAFMKSSFGNVQYRFYRRIRLSTS